MKLDQTPRWMVWTVSMLFICIIGWIDHLTGYEIDFFVLYFPPVAFVAWRLGLNASILIASMSSIVWFVANDLAGQPYSSSFIAVWNTGIRFSSLLAIGWAMATARQLFLAERKTAERLKSSLAEIKLLEGILPICAECKKIRNEQGKWLQMETYISKHSNAQFSHGYCPDCFKRAMAEAGFSPETPPADTPKTKRS